MQIRAYRLSDAAALAALENVSVEDPSAWAYTLRGRHTLVAEENERPIGFLSLEMLYGCSACLSARIVFLAVDSHFRGKGVARALVSEAERIARADGVSIILADPSDGARVALLALGYAAESESNTLRKYL